MNDLSALFAQLEIKYPLDRFDLIIRHLGSYNLAIHERMPATLSGPELKGPLIKTVFASSLERALTVLITGDPAEAFSDLMQIVEPNPAGKSGDNP